MGSVYRKELRSYFCNMQGAIFAGFLLLVTGIMTSLYNFKGLYPTFENSLAETGFIFLLIVPVLTMKILAEERHQRTDQLLYSLPLKVSSVVLGKYLALLTVFLIPVAVMSLYPIILSMYGEVSLVSAYSAIFGFVLLGAALLAIGMFISSVTESQVIAAVLTFGVMLAIFLMNAIVSLIPATAMGSVIAFSVCCVAAGALVCFMTKDIWVGATVCIALEAVTLLCYNLYKDSFAGLFPKILMQLSVFDRFYTFVGGMFDLSAVVFYLSVIAFCLFLCVQSVEKKRWS
ncbi:MAG: ABC transporter permease subunit [Clostridia bacterium]|nr:ABC transporter permease subunit [Clostridia bacterium]